MVGNDFRYKCVSHNEDNTAMKKEKKKQEQPKKTKKVEKTEPKEEQFFEDHEADFGGFPDRDMKKNMGCGG